MLGIREIAVFFFFYVSGGSHLSSSASCEGFLFFLIRCLVLSYLPLLLLAVSPRFSICLAPTKRGKMKILFFLFIC